MPTKTANTTKPKKRIGRPSRRAAKGKRASLAFMVSAEVKNLIDQEAEKSGRSQSQVVEQMIEQKLQYDRTLAAMHTDLAEMEKGNVEAVLPRKGYTLRRHIVSGKAWKYWTEPGFPGIERTRWEESDQ